MYILCDIIHIMMTACAAAYRATCGKTESVNTMFIKFSLWGGGGGSLPQVIPPTERQPAEKAISDRIMMMMTLK